MALNLSEARSGPTAFVGGLSIDNLSFWFWVKAGIGFTLGASTVGVLLVAMTWLFWLTVLGGLLTMLHR